ncbi:MAG: hypothetical protein JWO77_3559 [Ilumatobacteraceae bacterium]|nr:hypothetical protein [Ilumatobacteraceae bacterium]
MTGLSGCNWNLAASEQSFLREYPGEPRNWYHRMEAETRSGWGAKAQDILDLEPPHSNDFWLEGSLIDLLNLSPPSIRQQVDAVFVVRTMSLQMNAEAWMPRKGEQLVGVYDGTRGVLLAYAAIMRRCYHLMRSQAERGHGTVGETVTSYLSEMDELLADPVVEILNRQRQGWASGQDAYLDEAAADLLNSYDEVGPSGLVTIRELLDLADHFVLGHEIGHHVLAHTHPPQWGGCAFPARLLLAQARHDLGVEVGHGWTERQEMEFDADAFGFLLYAGWFTEDEPDRTEWYRAIFAAMLALPALEDLASGPVPDSGKRFAMSEPEYPPLADRIDQIARLVQAFPQELQKEDPHHPVGLLQQMLLFRAFLVDSRRPVGDRK